MTTDEYLTTSEVAELLKTPSNTLHKWRTRDYGPPAAKVGRRLLYRRTDVLEWVSSRIGAAA